MTDDIVTRLIAEIADSSSDTSMTLLAEAADEIERLRKESYVWEMAARQLAKELGQEAYADAAYQDEYDIFEDAERGVL